MTAEGLIRTIYKICTSELLPNYSEQDHLDYIKYRLAGGDKREDEWLIKLL